MMRALVIEDTDDIRFLFSQTLTSAGFEVEEAEGGDAGLDALTAPDLPDVVILDVQMPDRDGWEVLARIRADPRTAEIPVVLCTVKGRFDDVIRGWDAGCDGYVVKPFDLDSFIDEVRAVLARSPDERARARAEGLARARRAAEEMTEGSER